MIPHTAIPKYYRLRLSEALQSLLTALPIEQFVEVHEGDHIYLGIGLLRWGNNYRKSRVRVGLRDGSIFASAETDIGAIVCPFNGAGERELAIQMFRDRLDLNWQ